MNTPRPILWVDVDRVSPESLQQLAEECAHDRTILLPCLGDKRPPCGYVLERWPTPDELFRWRPKMVIEEFVEMERLLDE
jgi:hypothetical protein